MKEMIAKLYKEIPDCKKRVEHAILSDESYNLLDKMKN